MNAQRLIAGGLTLFACLLGGCASYTTPGGPASLSVVDNAREGTAGAAPQPAANFPARLVVVRVQAPGYGSESGAATFGDGAFTVVTSQELLTEDQITAMGQWPEVKAVAPLGRLLVPAQLESLEDLRRAAAQLQADVLVVYTLDTGFTVKGRGYGPLAAISLGLVPDRDAFVTSTASALFTDVRTGFVYGLAEGTAKADGLTNVWGSASTVDEKRLEAEHAAFRKLVAEMGKGWDGIVREHAWGGS